MGFFDRLRGKESKQTEATSVATASELEPQVVWKISSTGAPGCLAFSTDGQYLVFPSDTYGPGGLFVHQASDGKHVRRLGERAYIDLAFLPDEGTPVVTTASERSVDLWRFADGAMLRSWQEDARIFSLAFASGLDQLLAVGVGMWINLRKWQDGSLVRTLKGHTNAVKSVAFSPGGEFLASGSVGSKADQALCLWQVGDGLLLHTLEEQEEAQPDSKGIYHGGGVNSVIFSPNGEFLASGSVDGKIRLWRVSDGTLVRTLEGHNEGVYTVAFSPDGNILASTGGYDDKTVHLWRVADGTLLHSLVAPDAFKKALGVAFSPDGKLLAAGIGGSMQDHIYMWRIQ